MTETTDDAFLGGRVSIRQPAQGYRAAMDPVLLAAAIPDLSKGRALDLGCGVGTALLCFADRNPDISLHGLELDPATAELARHNAKTNGVAGRTDIVTGDILSKDHPSLPANGFDRVFTNPPFLDRTAGDASPDAHRARSNVEGDASLRDWVKAMLRLTRPKGAVAIIHRADRLDEILSHLHGKAGEIETIPLWPRAGQPAKRVIIRARKGVKGGARIHPGLILHGSDGERYTEAASAILRDGEPLR